MSVSAGTAFVSVLPDLRSFTGPLVKQVDEAMSSAASSASKTFSSKLAAGLKTINIGQALGAGLAIAAAAGIAHGLQSAIDKTVELADETRLLSMQLGITAEEASGLRVAGEELGISTQTLATGFGFFEKNLVNVTPSLAKYGITLKDSEGNQKSFNTVLGEAADKYVALGGGELGAAFAMNAFGRGGKALIPILALGSAGIKELEAEASKLGLTFSQSDLLAARAFGIAQRQLNEATQGLQVSIGKGLIPIETTLIHVMTDVVTVFEKIPGPVKDVILVGGLLTAGVTALGLTLKVVRAGLQGFAAAEVEAGASAGIFAKGVGLAQSFIGALAVPLTVGAAAFILFRRGADEGNAALASAQQTILKYGSSSKQAAGAVDYLTASMVHQTGKATVPTSVQVGQLNSKLAELDAASHHSATGVQAMADKLFNEQSALAQDTLAIIANRDARLGLEGGILGVESAILSAGAATRQIKTDESALAGTEKALTKLRAEGKQGTKEYAQALRDNAAAQQQLKGDSVASLQAQVNLSSSAVAYAQTLTGPVAAAYANLVKVQGDSKATTADLTAAQNTYAAALAAEGPAQAAAVKALEKAGAAAGLSKKQVDALITSAFGYIDSIKGIPPLKTTKVTAPNLAGLIVQAQAYNLALGNIPGRIDTYIAAHYSSTGTPGRSGGLQYAAGAVFPKLAGGGQLFSSRVGTFQAGEGNYPTFLGQGKEVVAGNTGVTPLTDRIIDRMGDRVGDRAFGGAGGGSNALILEIRRFTQAVDRLARRPVSVQVNRREIAQAVANQGVYDS